MSSRPVVPRGEGNKDHPPMGGPLPGRVVGLERCSSETEAHRSGKSCKHPNCAWPSSALVRLILQAPNPFSLPGARIIQSRSQGGWCSSSSHQQARLSMGEQGCDARRGNGTAVCADIAAANLGMAPNVAAVEPAAAPGPAMAVRSRPACPCISAALRAGGSSSASSSTASMSWQFLS